MIRRTAALLADLKRHSPTAALGDAEQQLASLQATNQKVVPREEEARYALFLKACELRRRIAFANPLLNFKELLFAKRHRAIYTHMCDQYYGIAARPGGGLYVLSDPWGPNPRLRDVLAEATVGNGRLKGQKLSGGPNRWWNIDYDGMGHLNGEETVGGAFLSPDLSYDGQKILFAYVECTGDRNHMHHTDPDRGHWAARALLPRFSSQCRWFGPDAIERWNVERFRPAVDAQRASRLHQRAAGRLPAVRAGLPDLHALRHGVGWQRHSPAELPRFE